MRRPTRKAAHSGCVEGTLSTEWSTGEVERLVHVVQLRGKSQGNRVRSMEHDNDHTEPVSPHPAHYLSERGGTSNDQFKSTTTRRLRTIARRGAVPRNG